MGARPIDCLQLLAIIAVSVPLLLFSPGCGSAGPLPDGTSAVLVPDGVAPVSDDRIVGDSETGEVYVRDEVLVYLDPGMTQSEWEDALGIVGGSVVGGIPSVGLLQVQLAGVTSRTELDRRIALLADNAKVALVAPNLVVCEPNDGVEGLAVSARRITDDPEVEWGVDGSLRHWHHIQSRVIDAWDSIAGAPEVSVGVVDFNLPIEHPDLAGNMTAKTSYDADFRGTDHGIQMCGVMAAQGNNAQGITGACWDVDLRYYDVSNPSGQAPWSAVMAAFVSASEDGCRIVNFSGGTWVGISSGYAYRDLLRPVVKQMGKLGTILCTSAGNDSGDAQGNTFKGLGSDPTLTNVLVVGALAPTEWDAMGTWTYELADYSNYGPSVGLCAPGSDIWTTTAQAGAPGYGSASGTGPAAAYVAGVMALMVAANPDLTPQQIRDILIGSASGTVTGADGLAIPVLDADAALAAIPGTGFPVAVLKANATHFASPPATVVFDPRSSGPGPGSTVSNWSLDFGDGSPPKMGSGAPSSAVTHEYTERGVFRAVLTITNSSGMTDTHSLIVSVGLGNLPVIID